MAKIISISITEEEKQYLDDMELSPTALFKQKLLELMTSSRAQAKRIRQLEQDYEKLDKISMDRLKFIMDNGLIEKYNGII